MVWPDKKQLQLHDYPHDYDALDCDDNIDNVLAVSSFLFWCFRNFKKLARKILLKAGECLELKR